MILRLGTLFVALLLIAGCTSSHPYGPAMQSANPNETVANFTACELYNWPLDANGAPTCKWRTLNLSANVFQTEPGCGNAYFDIISQRPNEVVFKITKYYGLPYDFSTGEAIARADAIGKEYRVRTKGKSIVAISEIHHL